ncbi:cytochrome P450 [bacterium]|nr:MAG: cytochrome P450 [bacterium]
MTRLTTSVIPGPKPAPIIGNIQDIDTHAVVQSLMGLADTYGPIFRLELPGREMLVVSSQQLVNELCDEKRFDKKVHQSLWQVRDFTGDGLFTAQTQEPNWGKAHRILMPVFGPAALYRMFPGMLDIAEQLVLKWERQGPDARIDLVDSMTRLTLDTIALCAFDYRFNSFYERDMHPFIGAMVRALSESGGRSHRLPIQTRLMLFTRHQYDEDIRLMHQIADELISERKKQGHVEGQNDILTTMLTATDPQSGERLTDENIRNQMVTFLIAGHETTSGLLSFAIHALLRNPHVMAKARAEVERVMGSGTPKFEHLAQLTYLDQILKETLRLWPTAPAFAVYPYEQETTLGGKYVIRNSQTMLILAPSLHRDKTVWGENAEEFNPDNFAFENAQNLPPNAWKPFGNGQRACIGRAFALQEATLLLGMVLQRFDLSLADPDYKLEIKETLTLKPHDFFIKARQRENIVTEAPTTAVKAKPAPKPIAEPEASHNVPLHVLFGSNAGSSEFFAQRIATDAKAQGYAPTIATLDSSTGKLPADGVVVILASSYEGQPPDNAKQFVSWLEGVPARSLEGINYVVFGCGNKDWARTYQAIPKYIDDTLSAAGAKRLMERGEANARGDFFGDFDKWYSDFWTQIGASFGQTERLTAPMPQLEVEFVSGASDSLIRHNELQMGMVVKNRELANLSAPNARSKRHIEIALPEGETYRAGDYLSVLPINPADNVDRALQRFGLSYDTHVVIRTSSGVQTFFPTNQPVTVGELLASYIELNSPATRKQIEHLAVSTPCPPEKKEMEELIRDDETYIESVLKKRVSVLDLLVRYQSCGLPFGAFLQMVQPLKARQYSISSSPLWSADHCTLTIAVLDEPSLSGLGRHQGVASTYMAGARPGSKVAVTVKQSNISFHPPESLATPLIMVCAGTGMAPFRGFIQERALRAEREENPDVAPTLLFFGCTDPDVDFLYKDELAKLEEEGVVSVRPAYSRKPEGDIKYVQDRIWQDRAEIVALVKQGASFYVCGDGQRMAPAVHDVCVRIYCEATGATPEAAEKWMTEMERIHGRYVADVFA